MRTIFTFLLLLIPPTIASANTYYIAVNGSDANPGSITKPFASIRKAQDKAQPGDTVYIRGGVYHIQEAQITSQQRIWAYVNIMDKSGKPNAYINYFAYPNEKPVFDYTAVKADGYRIIAFYVTGNYIHFKGFEVTGIQITIKTHTQAECFENRGNNNIYEMLSMHDGMAIGFYLLSGSNNLILNCDAYRNYDSVSENGKGGNTDGFGCHPQAGSRNNIFRGCRAWFNSDDGYDCINSHESVTFDHCWSFYNGYSTDFKSLGDGNGFKAGGYARRPADELPDPIPPHTVKFCLAVGNKVNGFYSNHHITGSFWYNNSAYRNANNFNLLNRLKDDVNADVPGYGHKMRNNLGYKARNKELTSLDAAKCDLSNNYFDLNLDATDADFVSLDENLLSAPRQADGSLPDNGFMRLKPGSKFVDKGQDIGYPFNGAAPDLGCFELGMKYGY